MSRSLKKGPFIETKLLKRIEAMNQKNEEGAAAIGRPLFGSFLCKGNLWIAVA